MNRKQLGSLYQEHSRGLLAYACSLTSSFAAAEDIVHQIFEKLLRDNIKIEGSAARYLYVSVRNASLNQIRDRRKETSLDDGWLESQPGMEQAGIELQSALRELPAEQREVILLHVWAEMTFEQVANALGISANTAASRYRYGLGKLRNQFQATSRSSHGAR